MAKKTTEPGKRGPGRPATGNRPVTLAMMLPPEAEARFRKAVGLGSIGGFVTSVVLEHLAAGAPTAPLPWRTGRKLGRTIYDAEDRYLGMMETRELATRVCEAVNGKAKP